VGGAKVVYVDLTDERARALGLALNRTGDLAGWDPEMLERVLAEMPADPEVDWSALGVGDKDLAAMAEEAWGARHAEEQASRTAKTPASDRLCDLMVTDPPYGVSYADKHISRVHAPIIGDDGTTEDMTAEKATRVAG